MSKHSEQDHSFSKKPLSFLRFWSFVSSEIGSHRLSINSSAKDLKNIFTSNTIHAEHIRDVVLNSYQPHKDQLQQPIDLNRLLDQLGAAAYELKQQDADDLMDIELLEELAWIISTHFMHLVELPKQTEAQPPAQANFVFQMANYKKR